MSAFKLSSCHPTSRRFNRRNTAFTDGCPQWRIYKGDWGDISPGREGKKATLRADFRQPVMHFGSGSSLLYRSFPGPSDPKIRHWMSAFCYPRVFCVLCWISVKMISFFYLRVRQAHRQTISNLPLEYLNKVFSEITQKIVKIMNWCSAVLIQSRILLACRQKKS
jgi:hypothetical protein